jgi:hypothetical protein
LDFVAAAARCFAFLYTIQEIALDLQDLALDLVLHTTSKILSIPKIYG